MPCDEYVNAYPESWPGCTGCGLPHDVTAPPAMVICRPTVKKRRIETMRCPLHRQVEGGEFWDEEWYGRYGTWDCGTRLFGSEEWRLPEGMSERAYRSLDRTIRPEHYAKYDARRGAHGRFVGVFSSPRPEGRNDG